VTRSRHAGRTWLPAIVIVGAVLLAVPSTALAARAWTLSASPTTIPAGSATTVTLTVQNVGSSSGGDEITCVQVSVPSAFSVSAATIVSVKGVTSAAVHGWVVVTGPGTGGTIVTFKNPPDKNPLVGLPVGDSAVFRISGTASSAGSLMWTTIAADKPGGSTSTSCGSGTFPTISLAFTVGASPTPTPPPTPTPTPTPTATPIPTPTPTPRPTIRPTPTPMPSSTLPASPAPTSSEAPSSGSGSASPPPAAASSTTPSSGVGGAGPGSSSGLGGAGGAGGADGGSPSPPQGPDSTERFVIPHSGGRQGSVTVVAGLDATVRTALLDIGLTGWTVPALALSVPGILVVIVVALQLVGGAAWLPVARRILSRTTAPNGPARSKTRPGGRIPRG
jgi:hypothetical protein